MPFKTYIDRIKYIDNLIRRKATGDLKSLSTKLHLSKSHTMSILKELKEMGFPIKYSRTLGCYYYTHEGDFLMDILKKEFKNKIEGLDDTDLSHIYGGISVFRIFDDKILERYSSK